MRLPSLLLAFSLAAVVPVEATDVTPNERIKQNLIVRAAPNSNAGIIGRLNPEETRPFSKSVPYYYEIDFTAMVKGYVHKGYTSLIDDQPIAENIPLSLHFIDVGQGDSTLITCPNGKNILVDAGTTSGGSAEDMREYIGHALTGRDFRIHSLVITHPDGDHYNLLESVLDDIPVDKVFWSGVKYDFAKRSFKDWFFGENNHPDIFKNKRTNLGADYFDRQGEPNPDIDCGEADIYVLAAGIEASSSRKNALSIVLMVDYGDFEAILTGDATKATEKAILGRYDTSWLDVEVLKIGHHGSLSTSTGKTWADTLSPEYSIVSAGNNSSHGHPRLEIINRVEPHALGAAVPHRVNAATGKRGAYNWSNPKINYTKHIYSTVNSGTVQVKFDGVNTAIITAEN